jgi:hypothetical protein
MAIVWTETVPSITSQVGQFPRYAQSVWTSIAIGLARSLYWDGSGNASVASAGGLAPGGSRAFFDVRSNSSAPNSQMTARAFLCSDTSRLYMYDSNATYLAGTPFLEEYQTGPAQGNNVLVQSGTTTLTLNSGNTVFTITFPAPFSAAPTSAMVTMQTTAVGSNTHFADIFGTPAATFIQIKFSSTVGSSTNTFFWTAIGSSASYL